MSLLGWVVRSPVGRVSNRRRYASLRLYRYPDYLINHAFLCIGQTSSAPTFIDTPPAKKSLEWVPTEAPSAPTVAASVTRPVNAAEDVITVPLSSPAVQSPSAEPTPVPEAVAPAAPVEAPAATPAPVVPEPVALPAPEPEAVAVAVSPVVPETVAAPTPAPSAATHKRETSTHVPLEFNKETGIVIKDTAELEAPPAVVPVQAAPNVDGDSTHAPISFSKAPKATPVVEPTPIVEPTPVAESTPVVEPTAEPIVVAEPTPTPPTEVSTVKVNGDSTHAPITFSKGAKGAVNGAVTVIAAAAVADLLPVVAPLAHSPSPDSLVNTHTPISFSKATGAALRKIAATPPVAAVEPEKAAPVAVESVPVAAETEPVVEVTPAAALAAVEPEASTVVSVATPEPVAEEATTAAVATVPVETKAEDKAVVTNGAVTTSVAEPAPVAKTEATVDAPSSTPAAAAPALPSPPTTPTRKSFGTGSMRRSSLSAVRASLSKKPFPSEKDAAGESSPSPSKFSLRSAASIGQKRHSIFSGKGGSEADTSVDGDSSKYGIAPRKKKLSFIAKVKRVFSDHSHHHPDKA